jgi:hypothetical protein
LQWIEQKQVATERWQKTHFREKRAYLRISHRFSAGIHDRNGLFSTIADTAASRQIKPAFTERGKPQPKKLNHGWNRMGTDGAKEFVKGMIGKGMGITDS